MRTIKKVILSPFYKWETLGKGEVYTSGVVHGGLLVFLIVIILAGVVLL